MEKRHNGTKKLKHKKMLGNKFKRISFSFRRRLFCCCFLGSHTQNRDIIVKAQEEKDLTQALDLDEDAITKSD